VWWRSSNGKEEKKDGREGGREGENKGVMMKI